MPSSRRRASCSTRACASHERSRIARDLHDLLGHNLAALSLNLEIASHFAEGEAAARVETAQSVTKLLLGDVRGAVDALRDAGELDLPAALRKLADGIPRPRIHVAVPEDLDVADPAAGEVVLRCAQEMVTNAMRHAGAENVWIESDGAARRWRFWRGTTARARRACRPAVA